MNEEIKAIKESLKSLDEQNKALSLKVQDLEKQNDEILFTLKKLYIATPANLEELMLRIDRIVKSVEMKLKRG